MRRNTSRLLFASLLYISAAGVAASCASSDEEIFPAGTGKDDDAGADSSTGGSAGTGTAGTAGTSGGTGGVGGGVGGGGSGGAAGGGAGGTGGGSCNESFCPNPGFGTPCCVTPNGPCGADMGMGCMPTMPPQG